MHGPYTFSKRERLQRGHEFRRVYEQGRKVTSAWMVLFVRDASPLEPSLRPTEPSPRPPASRRVGIVTSRKVGNAVQRNRARRLLREAYRRQQHELKPHIELVLVARQAINGRKLSEVEAALRGLLAHAGAFAT